MLVLSLLTTAIRLGLLGGLVVAVFKIFSLLLEIKTQIWSMHRAIVQELHMLREQLQRQMSPMSPTEIYAAIAAQMKKSEAEKELSPKQQIGKKILSAKQKENFRRRAEGLQKYWRERKKRERFQKSKEPESPAPIKISLSNDD